MIISRLELAMAVARGKKVLDIGGRKMPGNDDKFPKFAREYSRIGQGAREYKVVDVQKDALVDYTINLNQKEGVGELNRVIHEYQPEAIICMETLEHLNYHFEVMNLLASAVEKYGTTVLITLPNNSSWIVNHVIGITDHSIAFFKDIADRFVRRSDLGKWEVLNFPCTGKYLWYWPMVYILSGFQPTSWGFLIGDPKRNPDFSRLLQAG